MEKKKNIIKIFSHYKTSGDFYSETFEYKKYLFDDAFQIITFAETKVLEHPELYFKFATEYYDLKKLINKYGLVYVVTDKNGKNLDRDDKIKEGEEYIIKVSLNCLLYEISIRDDKTYHYFITGNYIRLDYKKKYGPEAATTRLYEFRDKINKKVVEYTKDRDYKIESYDNILIEIKGLEKDLDFEKDRFKTLKDILKPLYENVGILQVQVRKIPKIDLTKIGKDELIKLYTEVLKTIKDRGYKI